MFQGTGFSAASTSSPFGQTAFGKPTTTGFNAPVFGSNAGTSLFGSATTQQSGGLFGGSTATPAFGQAQTTQPTFGSFTSTSAVGTTGLFGAQTGTANTGGSLFGSNTTSAFGQAKPTTFGAFGTSGVGQTAAPAAQPGGSSLFGQPQAQSASGLFGAAPGFGAATGGTTVKFTPITGTDTMVKNGVTTNINTRHHCITCMKEYESKSLEELRLEDYAANRKGPRQGTQTGTVFGTNTGQMSLFGTGTAAPGATSNLFGATTDNKSLLGSTTNTGFGTTGGTVFGTTSSNLFGKPAGTATAFGAPTSTTAGTFAFNTTANANLFGASTQQTGLFGATSQPSTGFGTGTTAFSAFGTTQPSLFGEQKPAFGLGTNTFNLPKPPVGTTTSTPLFSGQKTAHHCSGGFVTTGFGQPAITSTAPTGFATPFGQQQQTGGLLGGASGGIKAPSTGFTFGQPTNTLGGNLTLGSGGSSLFGQQAQKPGGLFGSTNMGGTGLFGGGGGMNTFGNNTMFNTGSNTLGGTGGAGTSGLGPGGGLCLGTLGGQLNQSNQLGSAAVPAQFVNPIQQQLNLYTTLPYGDSPIFKNVLKGSAGGKVDDLLKPSSPAAQKALLSGQNYKVSSKPTTKLKIKPIETNSLTKKSLFDELDAEEEIVNTGNNSELWPVVSTRRLLIKPTISLPGDTVVSPLVSALQKRASISNNHSPNLSHHLPGSSSPVCDGPQLSPPLKHSTSFFNSTDNHKSASSTSSTPQANRNDNIGDVMSPVTHSSLQKKVLFKGTIDIDTSRTSNNSTEVRSRESKDNADQSTTSSSESDQDESVRTEYDSNSSCVGDRHPTVITLRRVGYYTIPTMDELANLVDKQGRCIVDNFTVGRLNYGNIFYPDSFDVAGLNLDEIVHFRHKEVTIYPNDATKPPVGEGLNRRAQVTLDRVWPVDKTTRLPITDPARISAMDYESKLSRASAKHGTHYVEYRPTTGSWVFKVDHFSKYGLTDSDEDDAAIDIKKIKLGVTAQTNGGTPGLLQSQQQQTQLHIPSKQVEEALTALMAEEDEDMDDDGITNPFDLDEELERRTLSPTAKLARQSGTNANKLQLMKASLFERTNVNIDGECLNFGDIVGDDDGMADEDLKLNSFKRFTDSLSWYHRQGAADILNMSQIADVTDNRLCKEDLLDRMEALTDRDEQRSQDMLIEDSFLKQQIDVAPKVFPYIRPKIYKLHYFGCGEVKPKHSFAQIDANAATNCIADLGFFKKFNFRVGVGPCNQFTVLSTMLNQNSSTSISNQYPLASSDLGKISIISPIAHSFESESKFSFQEGIIRHLDAALGVSLLEKTDRGPKISPRLGTDGLEVHYSIAEEIANNMEDPHTVLSSRVFGLMHALWAELDGMKGCEIGGYDHACLMLRKAAVSDWLQGALFANVTERAEINKGAGAVFAYMTGFKLAEACETSREMKDLQLSLLLSQSSGSWTTQQLIRRQLTQWRDTEADRHISLDRLKCYLLVAGLPVHKASQEFINTCEQMDWLTSFAIHFWYVTSASGTITDALLAYDESYKPNGYAVPPLPGYSNEYEILMSKSLKDNKEKSEQVYDLLYHLLHLFSEKSYALEQFLYPATHTPDQLDYRIVWLVMRILTALGYSHLSEYAASIIHSSFAIQLESHGLWEWAIFVLLHLRDDIRREHAVKRIIEKFVTLEEDCPKETFLIQRLAIPESWIYEAKATKAIFYKSYEDGARYLIKAGQWNKCHKLIAEHIASKAIINERYEFLEDLLNQLAERSLLISGWSGGGGGTILEYLTVVRKVDELVAARDPNALAYHLEEMQPQLTNLCRSIKLVPSKTATDRLAQCEMSKRTADLLQNLILGSISEQDIDEEDATIGGCVDALATLIAELPLASDYRLEQWLDVVNLWKRSIACSKMKT